MTTVLRRWHARLRQEVRAILSAHLTPRGIGGAVAIGVFIGLLPIYGLHLGTCVLVARALRLNQAVVYGAANISNPVFAPFLIAGQVWLGEVLLHGDASGLAPSELAHLSLWAMIRQAPDLLWACTVGSVLMGIVLGPGLGLLAYGFARWRQGHPEEPA